MGTSGAQAAGMAGTVVGTGGTGDLTVARGGKTPIQKALNSVVQVDANKIVGNYITGAQEYDRHAREAISYYADAISLAKKEISFGYADAQATLSPLSLAGHNAMNEWMRMLGMDGISQSEDYYKKLDPWAAGNKELEQFQQKLRDAEKYKSAEERTNAKSMILNEISRFKDTKQTQMDQEIAKLESQKKDIWSSKELDDLGMKSYTSNRDGGWKGYAITFDYQRNLFREQNDEKKRHNQGLDEQIKEVEAKYGEELQNITNFKGDFDSDYTTEDLRGYTGEQIEEKLASTPGYQFQLDQGTQAISRMAAATGELASGKTGAALVDYGQGLATNTYNNYMTNLANIAATGTQATGQMAANSINEAQSMGQLSTMQGQYGGQSITGIGQSYNQAYANVAAARERIAMFNAQMQYNSKQANLNRRAASSMGALNAMPSMMNASANMQQVQAGIYNQGQMAQGFMGAQMSPLQQYSGYWGSPQTSGGYASGWSL